MQVVMTPSKGVTHDPLRLLGVRSHLDAGGSGKTAVTGLDHVVLSIRRPQKDRLSLGLYMYMSYGPCDMEDPVDLSSSRRYRCESTRCWYRVSYFVEGGNVYPG